MCLGGCDADLHPVAGAWVWACCGGHLTVHTQSACSASAPLQPVTVVHARRHRQTADLCVGDGIGGAC